MFVFPTLVLVLISVSFLFGIVFWAFGIKKQGAQQAFNKSVLFVFTIPFCLVVGTIIVQIVMIVWMFVG